MNSLLKALNDPTRRAILELLKEQDLNAGSIAKHFKMSHPSISHHLDILKQANVVTSVKQGQYVVYSINLTVLDQLVNWVLSLNQQTP